MARRKPLNQRGFCWETLAALETFRGREPCGEYCFWRFDYCAFDCCENYAKWCDLCDSLERLTLDKKYNPLLLNRYQIYARIRDELYSINFKAGYQFQTAMQEYWEWLANQKSSKKPHSRR